MGLSTAPASDLPSRSVFGSVRGRLGVLMGAVTAIGAATVVVLLIALRHESVAHDHLVEELIPAQTDTRDLLGLVEDLSRELTASASDQPGDAQEAVETRARAMMVLRDHIRPRLANIDSLRAEFSAIEVQLDRWLTAAQSSTSDAISIHSDLRDQLLQFDDVLGDAVSASAADATDASRIATVTAITAGLLFLTSSAAIAIVGRRWISRPLDELTDDVSIVAGGDLQQPIRSNGPRELATLGHAVDSMRQRLLDSANRRVDSALIAGHQAESARIAGLLHDDPIQAMTLTSIRLQQLRRKVSDDAATAAVLADAQDATNAAIDRLRRMIFELHSPVLDTEGLRAAIEVYLDETFDDTMTCTITGDASDIPPAVAGLAYRLAREAMLNTYKHADATSIAVALDSTGTSLTVEITDDGTGFDIRSLSSERGHLGLEHSRQLAEAAGGTWTCTSAHGTGTTVTFSLPYPHATTASR